MADYYTSRRDEQLKQLARNYLTKCNFQGFTLLY